MHFQKFIFEAACFIVSIALASGYSAPMTSMEYKPQYIENEILKMHTVPPCIYIHIDLTYHCQFIISSNKKMAELLLLIWYTFQFHPTVALINFANA